jgi:hypothetical protein
MRNLIKIFLFISILLLIILVIYIDYTKYYNYKKISSSFKSDIELFSLDTLLSSYNYRGNDLRVYIDSIDGTDKVIIKGFPPTNIKLFTKDSIKFRVQHPTKELFLYSMLYNTNFFFSQLDKVSLKIPIESYNILKRNYLTFENSILEIPSFQPIAVNDHVLSERIIFTIFFQAYINENYPSEIELLNKLRKDIKQSLHFLMDDRFFMAGTNHGLMQIKALAQVRLFIKDKELTRIIDKTIDDRISTALDYFTGDDGAVYEASSSYWHFINKLYRNIYNLIKDNPNLKKKLIKRIDKIERFLNITAYNNGFVQGVGDGYSFYSNFGRSDNIVYKFSNNLGGSKWNIDSVHYGFQFISLNTPPNVHKLPEDLAFFLYIDQPIFINSGLYSYDQSVMRKSIVNEDSMHSVPYLLNEGRIKSSSLNFVNSKLNYNWKGSKIYESNKKIFREINLRKKKNFITIRDSSSSNKIIYTKFNIHPNITFSVNNDTIVFKSETGKELIKLYSESKFEIDKQLFPVGNNMTDSIISIKYSGNKNTIVLMLPSKIPNDFKLVNSNYLTKRNEIYELMLLRWQPIVPISKNDIKIVSLYYLIFTIFYFGIGLYYVKHF